MLIREHLQLGVHLATPDPAEVNGHDTVLC